MADTSFSAIMDAVDRTGRAFEEYKRVNDDRLDAIEKGDNSSASELDQKLTRIESDIRDTTRLKETIETEMKLQRERIEELEAAATRPGRSAEEKFSEEYKSNFFDWVRSGGKDTAMEAKLGDMRKKAAREYKALSIGVGADGGVAVPEEIAREINRLELKFSPVRDLVKVVSSSTSDYKELVNIRGTGAAWTGESGPRSESTTPQLRERTPTHGELYAYPQASEWALDDIFFNVEDWLADEVAQQFAVEEGTSVITGNGTNKPTGFLNTTPVLDADFASPLRSAEVIQYIASDTALSPVAPGVLADTLIDTVYTLNSAYRANATWVMNSTTTGAVRKLKTTDGEYHWAPGLQAGQPDMLLGYPVRTWEQMPDIAANAFPVAFGDWRRGYTLVDRVGLRITRDNITTVGFVKFFIRRREAGILTNNDAIKAIRTI